MRNDRIEIPSTGLLRIPISDTEWVERYYGRYAYGNIETGELRLYTKTSTIEYVAKDLSIDVSLIDELK